jgi:RNA polymerase sigma factor (sigma-70 family)
VATSQMRKVIDYIHRIVLAGGEAGLTDGQLLECFVKHRDEAAVAALVRRHGPLVWSVCRRILHSHHDVEDAFQATFLVLVRKAASITPREMVANWLYGVAHRTALKARSTTAKRQAREKQMNELPETAVGEPGPWIDLQPLLDQELSRLPDKYRAVIVLCDLQGKTRKETARQLGVPEGTVASRLATARTMLAKRLARQGLTVSGVALGTMLSQSVATAGLPASVVSNTIKAATLCAAGKMAASVVSTKVAALTEGVLKAMFLTKLKIVSAVLFVIGCTAFTFGIMARGQTERQGNEKKAVVSQVPPNQTQPFVLAPARHPIDEEKPRKPFTNSIGMKFVWIPPGTFMMGSPQEEKERSDDETQHKVTLTRGFYMGVYTVTQEQWQQVMGNNPSYFRGEANLPVEQVSWNDCQEFIKKLREKDKKQYRLPTEAEWEYACRAGTTTPFHFGDTISTEQAHYYGEAVYGNGKKGVCRNKTTPVGTFPANAWGLHDMHGNVWQWCQDGYGEYPRNDVLDPKGPEKDGIRVLRGGPWLYNPVECRSAHRFWRELGTPFYCYGLRVCFCLDDAPEKLQARPADDKEMGFKPLFNGKDLTGWKARFRDDKVDATGAFLAKDGILQVTGVLPSNDGYGQGYLYTEKPWKDYILRFSWIYPKDQPQNSHPSWHSDLLLHVEEPHKTWPKSVTWPKSIEMRGHYDGHGALNYHGLDEKKNSIELTQNPKDLQKALKAGDEWNTTEVTARADGSIEVRINGTLVSTGKSPLTSGHICITTAGRRFHLKDIQIKELGEQAADPGPDGAQAEFKRMEQPILKCKTFKADVEITGPTKDTNLKGRLLVAQGNKMRLELYGATKGKRNAMAIVSDGTAIRTESGASSGGDGWLFGLVKDQETPKQISEITVGSVTRSGVFVPTFILLEVAERGKKPERFDLEKQLAVSDIKLGKKETVSGKEAQALDYKLTLKNSKEPLGMTVWIDIKTHLPLRRVITLKVGTETFTVTETYTNAALDDQIDAKEFELPK